MVTMPLWYLMLSLSLVAFAGVAVGAWLRSSATPATLTAPAGEETAR